MCCKDLPPVAQANSGNGLQALASNAQPFCCMARTAYELRNAVWGVIDEGRAQVFWNDIPDLDREDYAALAKTALYGLSVPENQDDKLFVVLVKAMSRRTSAS